MRIDLEKKRRCSACGSMESGRIIYETLGENTFIDMSIIGRPKQKGERKITTGDAIAVQAFACLVCGHVDFYFEVIAPPEPEAVQAAQPDGAKPST